MAGLPTGTATVSEGVSTDNQPSDADELLSTKLAVPRLRASIVPRDALLARLDGGLQIKLTLVSAPAGFGKTTLVSEWIADLFRTSFEDGQQPPSNDLKVAWISLDASDNDPVRFWRYILTASRTFED